VAASFQSLYYRPQYERMSRRRAVDPNPQPGHASLKVETMYVVMTGMVLGLAISVPPGRAIFNGA
jgi:hypothetical protein